MHHYFKKAWLVAGSLCIAAALSAPVAAIAAPEAADVFIQRISTDVLTTAKNNNDVKAGNGSTILSLVEQKIIPYVDFERMTQLAAGRYWRQATPQQQQDLTAQFRSLLIYTYSGALSKVSNQQIQFLPMRSAPSDTDVEVRSQVSQSRGQPIQLNYRVEKSGDGWKVYDINVFGAWLIESYKNTFNSEITKGGIDGLIATLTAKNKERAAAFGK